MAKPPKKPKVEDIETEPGAEERFERSLVAPKYVRSSNSGFLIMGHRFEVSKDGGETLLLVYPPEAIRELAKILDDAETLHGPLPDMMLTPVYGTYTAGTRGPSA